MTLISQAETSFAHQKDLDFNFAVIAPTANFVETMAAFNGLSKHEAYDELEFIYSALGNVYRHFGGGDETLPFPPADKDIEQFVNDELSEKQLYGVRGYEEEIIFVSKRYLNGEGDDYDMMNSLGQY